MKNLNIILSITLQLIILIVATAQNQSTLLDELFQSNYSNSGSGASILISKKGKIIYQNQRGYANVEYNIPIKEHTSFAIGSITKQFTAAAILLLEERGQLNLDDSLSKHLTLLPKSYEQISIHQLLSHSSGIRDYPRVPDIRQRLRANLTPHEIVEMMENVSLDFKPGSKVSYSNTGYLLLGLIIEKIAGQEYADFLAENIFDPLQMTNTLVGSYEQVVTFRANGYSEDENDELINATFHSSSFAAGAIISTPIDLNKWIIGIQNEKILSKRSLKKMFNNYQLSNGEKTNLGYGWELNQIAGENCFEHSGFEPGYKANSVYFPEEELYVIVLQNNEYGSPTPTMINAAAICLGKPFPNKKNAAKLNSANIQQLTGTYELASGDQRIIFQKEEQLYIKAPGGHSSVLFAKNESTLFYEEGFRQLHFKKNDEGKVEKLLYKSRDHEITARKISNEIPIEQMAIKVAPEILKTLVGIYNFEAFTMTITYKNETLFAQPEGANPLPLTPKSNDHFVIEENGAELDFNMKQGVESLSLLLEGNKMSGMKVE